MKKILLLLLGFSCSSIALESNPISPPSVNVADKFGVNLQTGQLARTLNTVSIGGELGLSHSVQLYTDLFTDGGYYGFVDGFAGRAKPENISQNSVSVMGNGDSLFLRDSGSPEYDHTKRISVMRVYGPVGSHDFLVYQNDVLSRDASAYTGTSTATGITFEALGDPRHTLVQSTDKTFLIWTTPDGTESKYTAGRLVEITYPNGFKVRVGYKSVTTNTGFMLKYQLNTQGLSGTPDQIVALNRANQYCSEDAATACSSTGWPTATFAWPLGTPSTFYSLGRPPSSYTVKMTTAAGVTDIQYLPEDVCVKDGGSVDANCAGSRSGPARWIPRLRSIKTPESTVPNYEYKYRNRGAMFGESDGYSIYTYWVLSSTAGQITEATLNGTDSSSYSTSTNSYNARFSWTSGDIWVESALYDINVIETVTDKKSGTYIYHKDARHLVEKYYPIAGRGPKQHYYYKGPRGNISEIYKIDASDNETLLQEATYATGSCTHPKVCNKPVSIKDARGNVTNYDYDPEGRFGNPIKITAPADKNGKRASTVYKYEQKYAYYKKNGDVITQDPDPIWMLASEHTCRTSEASDTGCSSGNLDMIKTSYYYGSQSAAQANNLLLTEKTITANNGSGQLITKRICYQYDKFGNKIGETEPKANLAQCAQ